MVTRIRIEARGERDEVTAELDTLKKACLKLLPAKVDDIPMAGTGWYETQQDIIELKTGFNEHEGRWEAYEGRIVIGIEAG